MSDKYVVSQEFMYELEEWKNNLTSSKRIYPEDISELYSENVIRHWWQGDGGGTDANNRLIAILNWVNGEDVFEVDNPKKWVVRSKEPQGSVDGEPLYIWFVDELTLETETEATMPPYIRRFDTKEEAQEWCNSHQEVIEVDE